MRRFHRAVVTASLIFTTTLFSGCVSFNAPFSGVDPGPHPATAHGYALLYDLMGDEGNVSKLLIIKRVRPELKDLIKEISARCSASHKDLEQMAKADGAFNLKNRALPFAEVKTRESISKARGKQLVGSKGKEFELNLLLTQNEALTYGAHLASVTSKAEKNPERIRLLRQLDTDLTRLQQQVVELMAAHYAYTQP